MTTRDINIREEESRKAWQELADAWLDALEEERGEEYMRKFLGEDWR